MSFLVQIVISDRIQHKNSLFKMKSLAASLSLHSIIIASIAYFVITHPIPIPEPEKAIVISLADFTQTHGDIHRIESSIITHQPKKPKLSPTPIQKQPLVQKSIQPLLTTPEKTPSLTPSVSPEASAPLAHSSISNTASHTLPSFSDSPHPTTTTSEKEAPKASISENQIGGAALGHIRAMIENAITYPTIARKLRLEGVVLVRFILKPDGTVETAQIKSSSGSNVLDSKAIQTILSLSGDYPALGKTFDLSIPIAFNLQKS